MPWARDAATATLVFADGHILCAVAARRLGHEIAFAARIRLGPTSLSVLGPQHVILALLRWNAPRTCRRTPSSR
ncbi:hypothetical protein [Kitasatospora sp. P5_F3]